MLAVQPTVELAKRFSRQRIDPLISESPALRERVKPARSRDAGNTVLSKEFPAGILVITGANSAVGLRSMPARYLFLDEVDAYPPSADEEGDPVALAEARTRTFSWRSQGLARLDADDPRALADRARVRGVRPAAVSSCRARIARRCNGSGSSGCAGRRAGPRPLIIYVRPATAGSRSTIRPRCSRPASGGRRRRAQDPGTIGFHISALYSPVGWFSWEHIARLCEARRPPTRPSAASRTACSARPGSRPARRRTGSASTSGARLGRSARCRVGGLFLTAGADVQKDRIEVDVWAWGRGLESWLVDHIVIEGGPEHAETWDELGAAARSHVAACARHAARPRQARDRHRLRGARRLCLGAAHGSRAGRADQGRRGLQPVGAGRGPDPCRCDRGRQEAAARRAALDDRGRDLQERDLSLPAAGAADRRGESPRAPAARQATSICRAAPMPSGSSSSSPSNWSRSRPSAASAGSNGRSCASATRRSTAGSTPVPPPGSPVPTVGPKPRGATLSDRSVRHLKPTT